MCVIAIECCCFLSIKHFIDILSTQSPLESHKGHMETPDPTLRASDLTSWQGLFLKGAHLTGWSQGGVLPFTRF